MARANKEIDVFKYIDMSGGPDACWPWQKSVGGLSRAMREGTKSASSRARPYFSVNGTKMTVTRLVYKLRRGRELGPDEVVRHTCDNSICCNDAHFEIGSHADNMADMVERDRHGLSSHVVRRIRVLLAKGTTHKEIGALYGVSREVVTHINNNRLHTHENDYPTQADFDKEEA